jgi:hypothetical protein
MGRVLTRKDISWPATYGMPPGKALDCNARWPYDHTTRDELRWAGQEPASRMRGACAIEAPECAQAASPATTMP